jgi:hypothetical protein
MYIKYSVGLILGILLASPVLAQPPGGRMGPPPGQPGGDWIKPLDSNQNEKLEPEELQAAINRTFAEFDRNANGTIEPGEHKFRPGPVGPPPGLPNAMGPRPQGSPPNDGKRLLPPFFFKEGLDRNEPLTRADFERNAKDVFKQMDRNGDGVVGKGESRPPNGPDRGPGPNGPPPPNAQFIAAELRFGDRLVKGQPFSAETVIEDTRRLFDGSTVTKSRRGGIYRDTEGRTRREQPIDLVGLTGDQAVTLVFVNDFPAKTQFSLDLANKVARKHPIWSNEFPFPDKDGPADAKTEQLGTKIIEGVKVEGTRITREIPVGHLGNDKPIAAVTERWFSPELQVIVMSRHVDPIAGEHIFRLVNIRRTEPSTELFAIPAGFRIENPPGKRPE